MKLVESAVTIGRSMVAEMIKRRCVTIAPPNADWRYALTAIERNRFTLEPKMASPCATVVKKIGSLRIVNDAVRNGPYRSGRKRASHSAILAVGQGLVNWPHAPD